MSMVSTLSALDRPDTSTFCLPKLNGSPSISKLPSIQENVLNEEQGDDDQEESARPRSMEDNDEDVEEICDGSRETLKPHQVVGFEFVDEKPSDINFVDVEVPNKLPSPLPKSPKYAGSSRPSTAPQGPDLPTSASKFRSSTSTPRSRDHHLAPILPKCASPVCRNRSGHELCYLCMQRASRNVPVNFSEERKRKEMEQTALLQQYQQMKDADAIAREKEKENQNRNINRKVAAYNLGISEGIREERNKRNTEFEKSYVLRDRALTPSRRYHQHDYGQALETQVKIRKARQTREKHDRQFQEKLEQVQLAEDLVKQREQFLRAKAEQVSQYQQALSVQVKNKPLPIPAMEPDSEGPIFGRFDATNEKLWERKQRAQETLKKQLSMVADKKEKINNENVLKLKEESAMLKRTKEELIADRIGRHKRSLDLRKSLEDHWKVHQDNKLKRIHDERQSLQTPGLLLLQQTDHYKRCAQCKRGTLNHGESNIWRESRYIPGSRLMV